MATLLALDTSTDGCSVALLHNQQTDEDFRIIPRQHSRQLLPMIDSLLARHQLRPTDLDGIAFGRGPGSFAGIRIATGVAQGLAFATDVPLLPVSTLEVLALDAIEQGQTQVVAALDARMDEIYWAAYTAQAGLPVPLLAEQVGPPEQVQVPHTHTGSWCGVGSGWRYQAQMSAQVQARVNPVLLEAYPRAGLMLRLAWRDYQQGKTCSPLAAQPVYLRDQVAWKKKDQQ